MVWTKIRKDGTPSKKPGPKAKHEVIDRPRFPKGTPRPHVWVTGTDPLRHEQYHCWQVHKAQCAFRKEEFDLSFEDYENLWQGSWDQRGRSPHNICMTRKDWDGPWSSDNVELISRADHFKRQGEERYKRHLQKQSQKYSKVKVK